MNKEKNMFLVHTVDIDVVTILIGKFFHFIALNAAKNIHWCPALYPLYVPGTCSFPYSCISQGYIVMIPLQHISERKSQHGKHGIASQIFHSIFILQLHQSHTHNFFNIQLTAQRFTVLI